MHPGAPPGVGEMDMEKYNLLFGRLYVRHDARHFPHDLRWIF